YPLAYYLAIKTTAKSRLFLIILVIVPFWTSFLIRTYAWMFILGGRGIPALLDLIGIEDVRLVNTPLAVGVGIVYGYLSLMVFPIYVSLEKLDKRLLEASDDLGANPFGTFRQVTLPLSAPGVITGCMLVFILLMGEYLIPQMLGGGKVFFIGNALVDLFLQSLNWPFGSACAMGLVIIMIITVTAYLKATRASAQRDVALMSDPGMLRGYSTFIYLFLYAPIALIVLFSFNSGNNASGFTGFSVMWYGRAFSNSLMTEALQNSVIVAFTSSTIASVIGTM